jgi:hypothetical protein
MSRWNKHEIAAGLVFCAVGVAAAAVALTYPLGTITRMGPGFVPTALGTLMALLSAGAAWQGRLLPAVALDVAPRPAFYILLGIMVWALLVDWIGFVPATMALVLIAARSEPEITFLQSLALALALSVSGYLIFIAGLGIPISAFWS